MSALMMCGVASAQNSTSAAEAHATSGAPQATVGKGQGHWGDMKGRLTADQISQLKDLRSQMQAGEITKDEFRQKMQAIVGDARMPAMGERGGMRHGGPGGELPIGKLAEKLGLSDTQKTQAKEIFKAAHTDIAALRDTAVQNAQALLTSDQQAIVNQFLANHPRHAAANAAANGTATEANAAAEAAAQPDAAATTDGASAATTNGAGNHFRYLRGGEFDGHKGMPPVGAGPGPLLPPPVIAQLNLTDAQKASLKTVREGFQASVKARMDQAKGDFRALLTSDQVNTLDQLKARRAQPVNPLGWTAGQALNGD